MEREYIGKNFGQDKGVSCGVLFPLLVAFLFFLLFSPFTAIAKKEGVYHSVSKGVTLYRISLAYKIPIAKLMGANGFTSPSALRVGQKVFIPGAKAVLSIPPAQPLSASETRDLENSLQTEEKPIYSADVEKEIGTPPWLGKELDIIWPIQGKINSPFGPRGKKLHAGIDIASPSYQEVKAAMDGEVILSRKSQKGYGNVVVLQHDLGYTTIYGHMNVILVKDGEAVRQGQAIGGVGSTGKSTGPHLHFELRHDRRPVDPLPILPLTIEDLLKRAAQRWP